MSFPLPLPKPVRRFVSRLKKRLHKGWRRLRTLAQGLFPSSSSKSCPSSGTGYGKESGEVWVNGKAMQSIPVAEVHTPEQLMRYVKQVNTYCCPGAAYSLGGETEYPHRGCALRCTCTNTSTTCALVQNQPVILKNFQQGFASRQQWMREGKSLDGLVYVFHGVQINISIPYSLVFAGRCTGSLTPLPCTRASQRSSVGSGTCQCV